MSKYCSFLPEYFSWAFKSKSVREWIPSSSLNPIGKLNSMSQAAQEDPQLLERIQLAVAPVFLLTAVAGMIAAVAGRLGGDLEPLALRGGPRRHCDAQRVESRISCAASPRTSRPRLSPPPPSHARRAHRPWSARPGRGSPSGPLPRSIVWSGSSWPIHAATATRPTGSYWASFCWSAVLTRARCWSWLTSGAEPRSGSPMRSASPSAR